MPRFHSHASIGSDRKREKRKPGQPNGQRTTGKPKPRNGKGTHTQTEHHHFVSIIFFCCRPRETRDETVFDARGTMRGGQPHYADVESTFTVSQGGFQRCPRGRHGGHDTIIGCSLREFFRPVGAKAACERAAPVVAVSEEFHVSVVTLAKVQGRVQRRLTCAHELRLLHCRGARPGFEPRAVDDEPWDIPRIEFTRLRRGLHLRGAYP